MLIEESDSLNQLTMGFPYSDKVEIRNVTINNCSFSGIDSTALMHFSLVGPEPIIVSGLAITNSNLGYRSGLASIASDFADISFSHLYFNNVTLNTGASLIKTGAVNSLSITDSVFVDVKQTAMNDNSNIMIELETLNLDSDDEFILSNLTAIQSSIGILKTSNFITSKSTSNSLKISNIVYKDSVFEFHQDLIKSETIEDENVFGVMLSNLEMFNLTFKRGGNIMNLKQQTYSGLQISDSSFYDISGGSIYLSSVNLKNDLKTKLTMNNITANRISGTLNSFFIIEEGGYLNVNNSTFTSMYNFEGGAVVTSSGQSAVAIFHV